MNIHKYIKILLVLLLPCMLMACNKEEVAESIDLMEPASIRIVTEQVSYGDVSNIKILEAYVIPYTKELSFTRNGIFSSFYVNIGDYVEKGELLAELDDEPFLLEVEGIKETMNELEKQHTEEINQLKEDLSVVKENLKQLDGQTDEADDKKVIEATRILFEIQVHILEEKINHSNEIHNIQLDKKRDELETAIAKTNRHQIVAPFDGEIVALKSLGEGNGIYADQAVLAIVDPKDKRITCKFITEADINESIEYCMYKDGKQYDITYLPYDKDEYAALILRQETPISTFLYEGEDEEIRHGDYVLICVVEDRKENILTVPVDALYKDSNGEYVYIDSNGIKVKKYVVTALADFMVIEIKEGLQEGEEVYVEN